MSYTTTTIVRTESPFKDTTNIDATYLSRAVDQADSYIDSKIGNVYTLPLTEVPALIQELSTKLAIYNLLTDQNLNIEVASGVNVTALLDQINAVLDDITSRNTKLIGSDGVELDLVDHMLPAGYPTTADTESGEAARFFTMDQTF